MRLDGKRALVVASQNVERNAGDEVALRVEADVGGAFALALIGQLAVERVLGGLFRAVDCDVELEVYGEGEANDIEAGADVGARAGRLDGEGLHG